jgi:hypothetical protein
MDSIGHRAQGGGEPAFFRTFEMNRQDVQGRPIYALSTPLSAAA